MQPSRLRIWPLVAAGLAGSIAFSSLVTVYIPVSRAAGISDNISGLVLSLAGLLWMLTTSFWARVANSFGRRLAVVTGLLGEAATLAAIAICIYSIESTSRIAVWGISILLVARILLSVFYGAVMPAINALIADHYPAEERTKPIAAVGAGQGAGIVLGPAIVALLSKFGMVWPLILASSLPLLAATILFLTTPKGIPIRSKGAVADLDIFDTRLRRPLLSAFTSMLAIVCAQLSIGYITMDFLNLSSRDSATTSGIVLSLVGVSILIAQAIVSKSEYSLRFYAQLGTALAGIGMLAAPYFAANNFGIELISASFCVGAFGIGLLMPAFQSDALNAVEKQLSSHAAGYISASMAAATVIGPSAISYLYAISVYGPFLIIFGLLACVMYSWNLNQSK